ERKISVSVGIIADGGEAATQLSVDDCAAKLYFVESCNGRGGLPELALGHEQLKVARVHLDRSKVDVHSFLIDPKIRSQFQKSLRPKTQASCSCRPRESSSAKLNDNAALFQSIDASGVASFGKIAPDDGLPIGESKWRTALHEFRAELTHGEFEHVKSKRLV